jgi:Flp pilus assembly protein TadG
MVASLKRFITRALNDSRGGVAIIGGFIIPLFVILLFVGVDMGRSYLVKVKAQEAIDAALIAAVASKDTKDYKEEFAQVFRANMRAAYMGAELEGEPEVNDTSSAEDTENNVTVYDASARVSVPVSYAGIHAGEPVTFTVYSQVKLGANTDRQIEVALALDNTGSMGVNNKISGLITASNDLVDIIFGKQSVSDNINVSVIPYDVVVRIGAGREDWIQSNSLDRYNAQPPGFAGNRRSDQMCATLYEDPGGTYTNTIYRNVADCTACTTEETCQSGGACYAIPPNPNRICSYQTGNPETGYSTVTYACPDPGNPNYCPPTYCTSPQESFYPPSSYWQSSPCGSNGLIDADDTPPTAGDNWRFRLPYAEAGIDNPWDIPSEQYIYQSNLAPILFASNSKAEVKSAINAMRISGATRIHIGLMWGWFTLSPKWQGLWDGSKPNLPKTPDPQNLDKVLVLMTDGKNYFPADNPITVEVCDAIKASGITVYTVGFGAAGEIDETLLRNCASQETNYFYAPNSAALNDAFKQIGGAIIYPTIRLTK